MTSINDVLKASKGLHVDDIFAQLWGRKLSSDYTIATYTGTLPAVLTGTEAGYLHRYKIYGNTEQASTPTPENPIVPQECGERTENLFDENAKNTANGYVNNRVLTAAGSYNSTPYYISEYIDIHGAEQVSFYNLNLSHSAGVVHEFLDEDKTRVSYFKATTQKLTMTVPTNAYYLRISVYKTNSDRIVVVKGSTAPESYIPYGYKLPLTSAGQSVDIYIGDDTLSTDEYVDSSTGKIYRMVGSVLTPTDPPVPFPQIPTSAGSTTISWAGEGLAPSQVELEYERK